MSVRHRSLPNTVETVAAASSRNAATTRLQRMHAACPGSLRVVTMRANGRGWRVLVVEDYADAAEVIAACFDLLGCESHFVTCGRAALESAETFEPQVVMVDLGLPDLDGFDVARELRRGRCRHAYLVALTGRVRLDDEARALEAGFDRLILKPIGLADIRELVSHVGAFGTKPVAQA